MRANSKCSAFDEWGTCNIPFEEHTNLNHKWQPKFAYKDHIEYGNERVYCGWPSYMAVQTISSHGNSVRSAVRKNSVCRACLKAYIFESSRDAFMTAQRESARNTRQLRSI